ncbi:MAG: porin family protein [Calditrichia bacterium]
MRSLYGIFLMLVIIFYFSVCMAQDHQMGPLVGLNLASVDVDGTEEEISTSFRTGFAAGGLFYLALTPNIGLQFEPTFMQKGSKAEVEFTEDGDRIKMDQTLKSNYLDIPLLLKVSVGQGSAQPYLVAGADIAFRVSDTKIKLDQVMVNGEDVTRLFSSEELEDELKTKTADFGLNIGAGISFSIGTNRIFIERQYNLGLTNVNDEEDADQVDVKTKGIQIKAGILFPIR